MNIEDLSKTQLLLLTVLVNFVTSIATGVLTVSLLDEAPATVTQTVNRIVEHTIETVTNETALPAVVPNIIPAIPPREPVVVKDEDLLTAAFADAAARTVTIHVKTATSPAIAYGVYLPKSRAVATITGLRLPKEAVIAFTDGSSVEASRTRAGSAVTVYGFSDSAALPGAPSPKLLSLEDIKQGQTALALGADRSAARGIVSRVDADGIYTTLAATPAGSAAVSLEGNIIGLSTGDPGVYVTAENIAALLAATSTPD